MGHATLPQSHDFQDGIGEGEPASFAMIEQKKLSKQKGNGGLMVRLFLERADSGTVIDRADQARKGTRKNAKHIQVPEGLAKFFKPMVAR